MNGSMRTPTLGPQPDISADGSPARAAASPHSSSLDELVHALERARLAEGKLKVVQNNAAALQDLVDANRQVCWASQHCQHRQRSAQVELMWFLPAFLCRRHSSGSCTTSSETRISRSLRPLCGVARWTTREGWLARRRTPSRARSVTTKLWKPPSRHVSSGSARIRFPSERATLQLTLVVQAELHAQKQQTAVVQKNLEYAQTMIEAEKTDLMERIENLQNLLLHIKVPSRNKDRAELEIENANLLDGFMPSVRDSIGEDALSRGVAAACMQKTIEAEALQVRCPFARVACQVVKVIGYQSLSRNECRLSGRRAKAAWRPSKNSTPKSSERSHKS